MKVNLLITIVFGFGLFNLVASEISCPAGSAEYFAHPTECNKFIWCHDGVPAVLACPTNFFWNAIELKCDWLFNVVCPGDEVVIPTPSSAPISPTTTVPPISNTPITENPSANTCRGICATGLDYYPSPTSCYKFIKCANCIEYEMNCPSGLKWNKEETVCDWPQNVQC